MDCIRPAIITKFPSVQENKKILKDQYTMITTAYPEADTLFKQSYNELIKRGYWRI